MGMWYWEPPRKAWYYLHLKGRKGTEGKEVPTHFWIAGRRWIRYLVWAKYGNSANALPRNANALLMHEGFTKISQKGG
jgi:hypothetical protein